MGDQTAMRGWVKAVAVGVTLAWSMPVQADDTPGDLYDALRLDEMISIMRDEGISYGVELGESMFQTDNPHWQDQLARIYDADRIRSAVRVGFTDALQGDDITTLTAFFTSQPGQTIVGLELDARRALIDAQVEDAARAAYRAADPDSARHQQIDRFVEVNDLLESNVSGAMNASFQFYRGLVDGGAFDMSEADILSDVWGQESETRTDTQEWLYAFLMLAYEPLPDSDLQAYVDMAASPQGRMLNRALFDAFNAVYDDISYALGLAAAQQMQTQDL